MNLLFSCEAATHVERTGSNAMAAAAEASRWDRRETLPLTVGIPARQ